MMMCSPYLVNVHLTFGQSTRISARKNNVIQVCQTKLSNDTHSHTFVSMTRGGARVQIRDGGLQCSVTGGLLDGRQGRRRENRTRVHAVARLHTHTHARIHAQSVGKLVIHTHGSSREKLTYGKMSLLNNSVGPHISLIPPNGIVCAWGCLNGPTLAALRDGVETKDAMPGFVHVLECLSG
jgi:hypothetical protein